jgi:hypothetical protein
MSSSLLSIVDMHSFHDLAFWMLVIASVVSETLLWCRLAERGHTGVVLLAAWVTGSIAILYIAIDVGAPHAAAPLKTAILVLFLLAVIGQYPLYLAYRHRRSKED